MAAMRGPRLQVGSAAWVTEERASALQITDSEVEEFTYSARNEFDWLNEHMAGIFNENETNIAETFKTPGKLRGKTPRTARKVQPAEPRVPLSNVFGATPSSTANRMAQLGQNQSPRLPPTSPSPIKTSSPHRNVFSPKPTLPQPATQDSGYYGSQDVGSMDVDLEGEDVSQIDQSMMDPQTSPQVTLSPANAIPSESPAKTSQSGKEEQATHASSDQDVPVTSPRAVEEEHTDVIESIASDPTSRHTSLAASSPTKIQSDTRKADEEEDQEDEVEQEPEPQQVEAQLDHSSLEEARSPSVTSSPIRPPVRKGSLNFASLPAREPLTAGKARASRTSHLDHNRTSYYGRHTGGKSIGNYTRHDASDEEDRDEMDVDDLTTAPAQDSQRATEVAANHNKTYTEKLQYQISMLGKSQPNGSRTSKSFHSLSSQHVSAPAQTVQEPRSPSPSRREPTATTPGAFPEDDDDDWIDPPAAERSEPERPALSKSHSTDVMEGIYDKDSATVIDGASKAQKTMSQQPATIGHGKSASVSVIPAASEYREGSPLKTVVSVPITSMATQELDRAPTLNKSPSRNLRDSPLKQVKNKLSSILKTSKGLLASSAAISAEGKSSILSPSTTRLDTYTNPLDSSKPKGSAEFQRLDPESPTLQRAASPTRPVAKRTRASAEREKEEKRREREAMLMAEQMDKLEKAREKEREKVRTFSKEQQRVAAMEKQVASKKDMENPIPKETPKPSRASPRKGKVQHTISKSADLDIDMFDAPITVPPSASRSVGPGPNIRNKETRRPVKPGKEVQAKSKPTPTVIRVNTGSQHSQFHPGSSTMSTSFQDTGAQSQQLSKASKASLQTKPSAQSLKSSVSSSTGRPKALDMAAKKKEQDEREAQRRRDAKAELERKRAAAQEEQRRQEQQRRQETEKQKQKEREQAEAKKNSQRQAAIEKAKQTRAPPPAVRSQPNGPPDHTQTGSSQREDIQPSRPPSRLNSGIFRSQEDLGRPVNVVLSTAKSKRPFGPDNGEASQARHAPSYGGPQYQAKDAKRRRTSDEFADELDMDHPPNIKGPPVRPSAGFKKDLQTKSIFQNGYSNVPQSASRDLFKATVTSQHTSQTKAAHPMDMAQISKGGIPFAPNSVGQSYKTPARPGAAKPPPKSALRSSPRFQNGELIELPEIDTDDEDDDDDETNGMTVAAWADSPDLRRALMRQETMDPSAIFGPPAPLNMEEVFNRGKEKFHKFRARTSSANWSGADRLTEEDIRKDIAARDKMRREGGWSYEMSREMM